MPDAHLRGLPRRAPRARRASTSSTCRSRRGWSSSTPSTGSRATRRPTSPSAGTARRPSAARAAPRSTAGRSLTCKTRLSDFDLDEPITVEPMRAFPLIRDLVTDVSWNYEVNKTIQPFTPPADVPQEDWRWQQQDIERVQEYRKCIECFLCQDVCHVLRNHETEKPFMGPRFLVRAAGLEMHPIDQADRREYLKDSGGIGYCNITKCCTEVCPEHIKITDNAIIPLKERVADEYYDPIQWAWRKLRGGGPSRREHVELPVLQGGPPPRPSHAGRGAPGPDAAPDPPPDRPPRAAAQGGSGARLSDTLFPDLEADARAPRPPTGATRGFVIRTDGAARGNPGPASLGAALYRPRAARRPDDPRAAPDASISDYLGVQTNNVAEYTGVVRALELARELGAREVHLLLDSKLIVEQLAGRWRVKDAKLHPAVGRGAADARRLRRAGPRRTCRAPRTRVADALANEAIDRVAAGGPASVVRRPGGLSRVPVGAAGRAVESARSARRSDGRASSAGQPVGGVRKVRAPQRRVAGNARPP